MLKNITLEVPGLPVSGSQLKFNRKSGNAYRPKEHIQRLEEIQKVAELHIPKNKWPLFPKGQMVSLSVDFYFPYRKSDYRTGSNSHLLKHNAPIFVIGNKDLDNLLKPLKDGLKKIVIADDNQIVMYGFITKKYTDEEPKTTIKLQQVNGVE